MTYEELLFDIATADARVVVMTAENRAALRTLPPRLGDRFIDVGIAEQTLVGAAAGLALRGRVPVIHALAAFLTMRAFEFIRTDIGIPGLPVKLVGAVAGFLSEANGPTHQAIEDVALMRGIPSMRIFCPADRDELVSGFAEIIHDPSPWYVRYTATAPSVAHKAPFTIGRAEMLADGDDLTLLTYGCLVGECWQAVDRLAQAGVSARLLNMRTLKPVDQDAIVDAARRTRRLVVVEDHFSTGGLATIVAEIVAARGLSVRLDSISLGSHWFTPALLADVLEHERFTPAHLAERILGLLPARASHASLAVPGVMTL